jgi:hypothetical protein
MAARAVHFILVYIDEAHSNAWPVFGAPTVDPVAKPTLWL